MTRVLSIGGTRATGFHAVRLLLGATVEWKGGTLQWGRLAEDAIRASGLDYCIVRAAFLLNSPGGRRAIDVRQAESGLSLTEAIAREDVAEALVHATTHPRASRTAMDIRWARGPRTKSWSELFDALKPD